MFGFEYHVVIDHVIRSSPILDNDLFMTLYTKSVIQSFDHISVLYVANYDNKTGPHRRHRHIHTQTHAHRHRQTHQWMVRVLPVTEH